MNWNFCEERDDSTPSDFDHYDSPSTTASESRGSTFGSPDSYDTADTCQPQYARYPNHAEAKCAVETSYSSELCYAQSKPNSNSFANFDAAMALAYGSRFAGATAEQAVVSAKIEPVSSPVSAELVTKISTDRTIESENAGVKRGRSPPTATVDTAAGSRSYRQQTSELINRLDKLLKFASKPGSTSSQGAKGARGDGPKGRSRRPPRDLAKPRARNVVLKQAAELIWRIKCDEQVASILSPFFFVLS